MRNLFTYNSWWQFLWSIYILTWLEIVVFITQSGKFLVKSCFALCHYFCWHLFCIESLKQIYYINKLHEEFSCNSCITHLLDWIPMFCTDSCGIICKWKVNKILDKANKKSHTTKKTWHEKEQTKQCSLVPFLFEIVICYCGLSVIFFCLLSPGPVEEPLQWEQISPYKISLFRECRFYVTES